MPLVAFAVLIAPLVFGVTASSQDLNGARVEFGLASWYGYPYHGRTAANGEVYDMELLTAAHRTLPLDSWVHVTNLVNYKSVDVRITDRGPFVDGRIIDLSHAAARAIDLIENGTAAVRIEAISALPGAQTARFAVQVGAFREKSNAERVRARMEQRYNSARIVRQTGERVIWRVLVGDESSRSDAGALAETLRGESAAAFVVEAADGPAPALEAAVR